MVDEIKRSLEEQKVFFGIKECLKKSKELERVVVAVDHRKDVARLLEANKVKFEVSEFSKQEIASRIGLDFKCEVFGIKK